MNNILQSTNTTFKRNNRLHPENPRNTTEQSFEEALEYHTHSIRNEASSQQSSSFIFSFLSEFISLYRYAQLKQRVAIAFGVILGLSSGISYPLFIYLWCSEVELTIQHVSNISAYLHEFRNYFFYFIGMGVAVLLFNGTVFMIWKHISRSISKKIRIKYLQAYVRRSMLELQKKSGYEWANEFKTHTINIEKSIGDKVALFLNLNGILLSGSIAALTIRWTLSLYMFILVIFGALVLLYFIYVQVQKKQIHAESNQVAQSKALQTTSMIKTVKMLNGQQKQSKDYEDKLKIGEQVESSFHWRLGLATGLFYFIQYLFFGIGFIMGVQCVRGTSFCPLGATGSTYKIGEFLVVFYQIFFCTYNFLQLGSNYNSIKTAIASSKEIFAFIQASNSSEEKVAQGQPQRLGRIKFENVHFSYPLNPERVILKKLNLELLEDKFNALAGFTGSGKSTVIQLLLKHYSPSSGVILIDEIDLVNINTPYWLDRIGIVTQEPVLFDGTIRENIQVGKPNATDQEIIESLQQANIYEFVSQLPEGLNFEVGVGGSKLSGGQKQRMAIARALVKKPSLLILDEATSALDRKTQGEIQETLEKIRRDNANRITIICIAHRLKTIESADRIFLMKDGVIIDSGTFHQIDYFREITLESSQEDGHQSEYQSERQRTERSDRKPQKSQNTQTDQKRIDIPVNEDNESIYSKLFSFTTNKVWYIVCLILAVIIGINHAVSGIFLTYSIQRQLHLYLLGNETNWCQLYSNTILYEQCSNKLDEYFYESEKYLYGLLGLALFMFFPYFVQVTVLSKIENEVTFNLRMSLFQKLLRLPVRFYEIAENESGGAATRCDNDPRDACGLLTAYIPILLSNFCTVTGAVVICSIYEWRLGLLSMLVTPLIALSFYISMLFIGGYEDSSLQKSSKADRISNELILNIKTVFALNYQQRMLEKYQRAIEQPITDTLLIGAKIGLLYGFAFFILEFVTGLALYLSVVIAVDNPEIPALSIIMFMTVSILSGFITGNNFYFIAHISAGKEAGVRVLNLIKLQTEEQVQKSKQSEQVLRGSEELVGNIEFKNVSFKYKPHDLKSVLSNLSFTVSPGSKVAFVGPSGCGKSTLLQLLLRFYEFDGEILLDGVNIYNYNLQQYRSYFAMLNQEPSLFEGSIEDNIRYGTQLSKVRLTQVCERACAYAINSSDLLPERIRLFVERRVGPKGSNISGGEKQRVACARALARKANFFLMDEGTSALDATTEKKVQRGLDAECEGKTMISIAHRLETISNSDLILVFSEGRLMEKGKYRDLMKRRSFFFQFATGQKLSS